jgi:hypothetical protein
MFIFNGFQIIKFTLLGVYNKLFKKVHIRCGYLELKNIWKYQQLKYNYIQMYIMVLKYESWNFGRM